MKRHAYERNRLAAIGRTAPFVDAQVASIVAVNDLILITNNVADSANFSGLNTENWFAP